ncbi:MAG: hypothetical protein M3Y42_09275 [Actinomycetota bacterium]|nr:hypothetical protein [Actinomycetota bacterium]MDQ2957143.1 hypothetical protein [Actinomycetota bacterium]
MSAIQEKCLQATAEAVSTSEPVLAQCRVLHGLREGVLTVTDRQMLLATCGTRFSKAVDLKRWPLARVADATFSDPAHSRKISANRLRVAFVREPFEAPPVPLEVNVIDGPAVGTDLPYMIKDARDQPR